RHGLPNARAALRDPAGLVQEPRDAPESLEVALDALRRGGALQRAEVGQQLAGPEEVVDRAEAVEPVVNRREVSPRDGLHRGERRALGLAEAAPVEGLELGQRRAVHV